MANIRRPLHKIAAEIMTDWDPVNFAAEPYVQAMTQLNAITDQYGQDSAKSIVQYFLANAQSWRGDVARRVKAELKQMVR